VCTKEEEKEKRKWLRGSSISWMIKISLTVTIVNDFLERVRKTVSCGKTNKH